MLIYARCDSARPRMETNSREKVCPNRVDGWPARLRRGVPPIAVFPGIGVNSCPFAVLCPVQFAARANPENPGRNATIGTVCHTAGFTSRFQRHVKSLTVLLAFVAARPKNEHSPKGRHAHLRESDAFTPRRRNSPALRRGRRGVRECAHPTFCCPGNKPTRRSDCPPRRRRRGPGCRR